MALAIDSFCGFTSFNPLGSPESSIFIGLTTRAIELFFLWQFRLTNAAISYIMVRQKRPYMHQAYQLSNIRKMGNYRVTGVIMSTSGRWRRLGNLMRLLFPTRAGKTRVSGSCKNHITLRCLCNILRILRAVKCLFSKEVFFYFCSKHSR